MSGKRPAGDVFVVGFVENRDHPGGQRGQEALDRPLGDPGPGRVVRVGDEHHAGARRHRGRHRGEVVGVLAHRHHDVRPAGGLGRELVDDEGPRGGNHLLAGTHERAHRDVDDLVRPVAQEDGLGRDLELRREGARQLEGAAVGVEVDLGQVRPQGAQDFRRGAERVLVRGQLDRSNSGRARARVPPSACRGHRGGSRRCGGGPGSSFLCLPVGGVGSQDLEHGARAANPGDDALNDRVGAVTVEIDEEHVVPGSSAATAGTRSW